MGFEEVVCDKLKDELDVLSGPIRGYNKAKSKVKATEAKINQAIRMMKATIFSPIEDLNNAINSIDTNLKGRLPKADETEQLINKLKQCPYFGDMYNPFDTLSKVTGVLNGLKGGLNNILNDLVSGLSNTIPEFNIANLLAGIMNDFGDGGLSDIMRNIDILIQCITALCGPTYLNELDAIIDEVNDAYDKMCMIDDPNHPDYLQLNIDKIGQQAGLAQSTIDNSIKSTTNLIVNTQKSITDSISSSTSALATYIGF